MSTRFSKKSRRPRRPKSQPVASSLQRHAVAINLAKRPPILFRQRQQAGGLEQLLRHDGSVQFRVARTHCSKSSARARSTTWKSRGWPRRCKSAITWTGVQAPQVVIDNKRPRKSTACSQVGIIYQTDEPDNPRLRLVKLASCGHALPGEEVEFTLRFDNIGDQVIGNVTIVDNLSTRLEYIAGSAVSSVDANFITEPNPTPAPPFCAGKSQTPSNPAKAACCGSARACGRLRCCVFRQLSNIDLPRLIRDA